MLGLLGDGQGRDGRGRVRDRVAGATERVLREAENFLKAYQAG